MKVLYCNPSFWDYRLPFYEELNGLFGGDFHVLYSTKRYRGGHQALLPRIVERLGENAHPWDGEIVYDHATRSFSGFTEGRGQTSLPFGLWPRIAALRPDVLLTEGFLQWTPLVQLYGLVHRIPVFVGYEKTPWTERNNSRLKTLKRRLQDRLVAGYLVNGSETRRYLESIGIRAEKIHIGGMSADSEGLRRGIAALPKEEVEALRKRCCPERDGLLYLFSGRVEDLKGAPHLAAVWADHVKRHPHDALVFIGMGDRYDDLKQRYAHLPSLHLEGRVPYDEVCRYYAAADVFVLPTLQDNWSLVIPEAMACGLPVATSIYNGCHPELIHEGENGTVFDPLQPDTMLRALDYFHHADLAAHGRRSLELEAEWATEKCARRQYEGILRGVADFHKKRT